MNFVVGDKVLVEYSTLQDNLVSVVADVAHGERITVFSPLYPKTVERIRKGATAWVRFVHEGKLYGYKTRVLNTVANTGDLVVLEFPEEIILSDQRKAHRADCCFPAKIHYGDDEYEAVIADLSENAFRVRFREINRSIGAESVGTMVQVRFFVFEKSNVYAVSCVVDRVFMRDYRQYAVLSIEEGQDEMRQKISGYVESRRRDGCLRLI